MAEIPEYQGFTQGAGPQPLATQSAPPPSAQPYAVAQGFDELSAHVNKLAQDEYERSTQEKAMQGVNAFQQTLIAARDKFGALQGHDAMSAYAPALDALTEQREAVYSSMGRRAGELFMNGSHGDFRIEVSNMEAHYSQARRGVALNTAKTQIDLGTRQFAAAALGGDGKTMDASWQNIEAKTRLSAANLGLSGVDADEYVQRQLAAPATAALRALSTPGALGDLKGTIEKYGQYADPRMVDSAEKALTTRYVNNTADLIVNKAPRLDALGEADDVDGVPSAASVSTQLNARRDDPNFDAIEARVQKLQRLEDNKRKAVGGELYLKLLAQAQVTDDGPSLTDAQDRINPADMDKLNALDPALHARLLAASNATSDKRLVRDKRAHIEASNAKLEQAESDLALDPSLPNYTPGTFIQKYGQDLTPADTGKAVKMLKDLQGQHKADNLYWVPREAKAALSSYFKPDDMKTIGSNPTYVHLVTALNRQVQAGKLKRDDPTKIMNFINDEMKLQGSFWNRKRRVDIEASEEDEASRRSGKTDYDPDN